jgi:retron-type reverse transcriptase
MKRYGNLYEKIYDMDNLYLAHKNARKGKAHYTEVKMVDSNPDYYLRQIHEMLKNKTYKTSPYEIFTKIDKGKEREIYKLPYYPDRIVHWAIVQIIEPIWMKTFIYDTYSSLKGRGIHKGLLRLHKAMKDRENTQYCLKFDIKKFYPSINHRILKQIIRKKIKDKDLLWLLDSIIDSVEGETNVPIGNYLSQYFGNLYLTYFDHWLKEEKKVKYYFRYCDDCVILHHDKAFLHQLRKDTEKYLYEKLILKIKENWQVFPTYIRGVDFLGYRSFGGYTLLRKSTAKTFKRKMRKLKKKESLTDRDICSIMSYKGWLKWCDGYNLEKKYIEPLLLKRRQI